MSVLRGPDGKIIETGGGGDDEQTRRIQRRSTKIEPPARSEAPTGGRPSTDEEPTDRLQRTAPAHETAPTEPAKEALPEGDGDAPKTQILRRPKSGDDDEGGGAQDKFMDDPVVGWVVVVKGPGRGASLPLGYGMNSIGRAKNERICLDFGDEQISRSQHAVITYDPRGRKYFVQHGGGKNLTYLELDQPVLTPVELKGGEEITLGDTVLRFIPFCGKDFDWQDQPDQ